MNPKVKSYKHVGHNIVEVDELNAAFIDDLITGEIIMIDDLDDLDVNELADLYRSQTSKKKVNNASATELRDFVVSAMEELEKNGLEDFVLLKNDKLRAWWTSEKKIRAACEAAAKEKERLAEVARLAKERYDHMMSSFSSEEKKLLGIK